MTARLFRVPMRFYEDHAGRDLPTPVNHSNARAYATVSTDDPALPELLNDAQFYADTMGDSAWSDCPRGVVMSAKATITAIQKATQ